MSFFDKKTRIYGPVVLSGKNGIGLSGLFLLFFSAALFYNEVQGQIPPRQTPTQAERAKAAAKPLVVDKQLFFQRAALGTITAIHPTNTPADSQTVFWIAAERGAVSVTDSGKPLLSVRFERMGGKVSPVDLEGDGNFEFLSRGGGQEEACLYNREGRRLWKYGLGTDPAVREAACGDLDGDGRSECVLAMKGNGGLRLLDRNGRLRWTKPEQNVWSVEILDWDGNGKNEIVYSNFAGQLRIRDGDGEIRTELPGNNYITLFSLCRWPDADSGWFILSNNKFSGIQLYDFKGKHVDSVPAPAKGYEVFGTPVRFEADGLYYFALLVCNSTPRRDSHLFIYNPEKEIIYQEKFFPPLAALRAVRDERTGEEFLLVGEGEGRVWKYRLVPAGTKDSH